MHASSVGTANDLTIARGYDLLCTYHYPGKKTPPITQDPQKTQVVVQYYII